MTDNYKPEAQNDQSGLGYNLGATIALAAVVGLIYASIATNVHNLRVADAVTIGLTAGIVVVTTVGLTIARHVAFRHLPNHGGYFMAALVIAIAFPFAITGLTWIIAPAAAAGYSLDVAADRSSSKP